MEKSSRPTVFNTPTSNSTVTAYELSRRIARPVKHDLSVHLHVKNFLSSALPSHNCSLVVEAASECFSDNLPNETPATLATLAEREIPPQKFIQEIKSGSGQAVLDRRKSIKDPLYEMSFLPFWILTLWERLAELNDAKIEWTLATKCFQGFSRTLNPTTSAATEKHLSRISWGAEITTGRGRATALTLPQLLADTSLDDTVLDLMGECIQMEIDYGGLTKA